MDTNEKDGILEWIRMLGQINWGEWWRMNDIFKWLFFKTHLFFQDWWTQAKDVLVIEGMLPSAGSLPGGPQQLRPKPGARITIQVFHMDGKTPVTQSVIAASHSVWAWNWSGTNARNRTQLLKCKMGLSEPCGYYLRAMLWAINFWGPNNLSNQSLEENLKRWWSFRNNKRVILSIK